MFRSSFRVRTHSFLVMFAMLATLLVAPRPVSQADEFSSSDHDPLVVGLELGEAGGTDSSELRTQQ